MSVEATKEALCINQIIGQKTFAAIVEEDFVVPDIKPDILNTINTDANICIYKKEIMDGKIKIEGSINAYIMYLADDEQSEIRSLNTTLDFSQIIDFETLRVGMMVEASLGIKQIECRVLNGRKVNVRAMLDIDLKAYSNDNLEFMEGIDDIKDIQLLKKHFDVNSLLGTGTTKVYAKDTIVIDNIDELMEIMKVNIDIKNEETKVSYNKILVKADAEVKIMYLTTDNRICTKTSLIPIMGFIDMQDVTDENICDVKFEIKNILLKPNSMEEHSIYTEIEIEMTACVYQNKSLDIIQDLYSPTVNLVYKQKIIKVIAKREVVKDLCAIRDKQIITEIGNNKIYDVDISPHINTQNVLADRIIFAGEVDVKILFASNNSAKLDSKTITLPFDFNMNCPGVNNETQINTRLQIASKDFVIMPDESIDIKIDLEFIVDTYRNEDISVIEEINIEENRDQERYSIIIYFVKPGDTLWKIAKRFRSTVDAIATLNNVEDEKNLQIGQQLFIPMSI